MQYIQLQPQVAPTVTLPVTGNLNLFLDYQDNLVKVVDSTGTVYGPTGNGVYITGGTYNANTGITTLTDSVGHQTQITGYFTTMNDLYVTGGTFTIATGTLDLVKNDGSIEPISGFTMFTGATYSAGTLNLKYNNNSPAFQVTGFTTPVFETITKTDLDSLISASALTAGNTYRITGVNPDLYGGTDIILQALSTTELSKNGHGLFYNPNYNQYDIWTNVSYIGYYNLTGYFQVGDTFYGDSGQVGELVTLPGEYSLNFVSLHGEFSAGTVFTSSTFTATTDYLYTPTWNIGDKVIWGGKVWEKMSADTGTSVNEIVGRGDGGHYVNFELGITNCVPNTLVITDGVETFTANTYGDLSGNLGGYGSMNFPYGNGQLYFQNTLTAGTPVYANYSYSGTEIEKSTWELDGKWRMVADNDTDYTPTWDIIEYEYENDTISYRKDITYNVEVLSTYYFTVDNWGFSSIKGMQWGSGDITNFSSKNAYLENLVNFIGNYVYNVTLDTGSSFDSNYWGYNTYLENINLAANSSLNFSTIGSNNYISGIELGSYSDVYNLNIANNDYSEIRFDSITLGSTDNYSSNNTYIRGLDIHMGSRFHGIVLGSSSSAPNSEDYITYLDTIQLLNGSGFFNIKMEEGSHISNISCYNGGRMRDIQVGRGAYLEYIDVFNYGDMFSIKLDGGSNYGNWSRESYIYEVQIGQNSYMHDVQLGLGSYIEYIDMSKNGCTFKYITLGNNSYISSFNYNDNGSDFRYNSLGIDSYFENISFSANSVFEYATLSDSAQVSNVVMLNNSSFNNNALANDSYIQYILIGNNSQFERNNLNVNSAINSVSVSDNAYFGTNDLSVNAFIGNIDIYSNGDMSYFQIGLDSEVTNLIINEGVYLGDITIGEYLFLSEATFSEDVYQRIIDRNNNNFPATLYIDDASDLNLGSIYYAGEVTLKTRKATIQYDNYGGTGFTIGDTIVDQQTNAQAQILSNVITSASIFDEVVGAGDGSQSAFTFTLANQRVQPYSVTISAYTNTIELMVDSTGDGTLFGNYGGTFGTINYATGECDVTFTNPVSAGTSVHAYYNTATGGTLTVNVADRFIPFQYGNDIDNNNGSNAYVVLYTQPSTNQTVSSIHNFPKIDYNNDFNGRVSPYNVTFLPESGLTVNFYGTQVGVIQNGEIAMPSTVFTASGSSGDYMTICGYRDSNRGLTYVQQIDAQNYVNGSVRTLPTITGANVTNTSYQQVDIEAFISDSGSYGPIIEKGFVWVQGYDNVPYLSDNKQADTGTTVGLFNLTLTGLNSNDWVVIRAYAINGAGVSYSNTQTVSPYICLAKGTQVTLSDGSTKNIEDVDYTDELKVWNFDDGHFDVAKPTFISVAQPTNQHNLIKFSDGSELRTILPHLGHRIFNIEKGEFTYPMTDDTPIGTSTFNDKGEIVTLVSKEIVNEDNEFYNVITAKHLNVFCNTILTSCRLNNMYPIVDMKFVKNIKPNETTLEVLMGISEEEYIDLRLSEQSMAIGEIVDYVNKKNAFRK
jgi:hypothetical protein